MTKALLLLGGLTMLAGGCATAPPGSGGIDPDCPAVPGEVVDRETPWTFAVEGGFRTTYRLHRTDGGPSSVTRSDATTVQVAGDARDVLLTHVTEGLTRLDCEGRVLPALASAWSDSADGRVWTFELRENARFPDGRPVDAAAVDRSWALSRRESHRTGAAAWEGLSLHGTAEGGRRVRVHLETPDPDFPRRAARPEFRIVSSRTEDGTRGRRVRELLPPKEGVVAGRTPPVRFVAFGSRDPRDVWTPDVHAMLTRDRDALQYLAGVPDTRLTPLPWSRRYLLVDPGGQLTSVTRLGASLRAELARDIAVSVARPADPAAAGSDGDDAYAGSELRTDPPRVLRYPEGDADARRLAERIASLAARDGGDAWTVEETTPGPLYTDETAAVLRVPVWRADSPFPVRTAWMAPTFPLIETRAFLVTRDDVAGITVDGFGIPVVDDAGFTRREDER